MPCAQCEKETGREVCAVGSMDLRSNPTSAEPHGQPAPAWVQVSSLALNARCSLEAGLWAQGWPPTEETGGSHRLCSCGYTRP